MVNQLAGATDQSGESASPIVRDVVVQHVEDASFLWLLRRSAVSWPHYSLLELAKLDNRVDAHLDGLRIAGEGGWKILKETLSFEEPCDLFAAASLAFDSGNREWIDFVLTLSAKKRELISGVVSALGWLSLEQARSHMQALISYNSPISRSVGIAAAAIHRVDPGALINEAITSDDASLRARALRAVGELGRVDLLPRMRGGFSDQDENARFAAAWSVTLLSPNRDSLALLRTFAETGGPFSSKALQTAIRRMDPAATSAWLEWFSRRKEGMRMAINAAAAIGDPRRVPWLIDLMKVPALARVAGESFTMITGLDLAYHHLDKSPPEGFISGPSDNPEDEDVSMDPDEHLPWPDPALIQKWWKDSAIRFQIGTRHILGRPMSVEWLRQVLRIGRQRQRAAAALELAIRQPGQPLFEVRAPGFRQQVALK
jgi:uncharacterized protein (TIGR02270 family)